MLGLMPVRACISIRESRERGKRERERESCDTTHLESHFESDSCESRHNRRLYIVDDDADDDIPVLSRIYRKTTEICSMVQRHFERVNISLLSSIYHSQ